MMKTSAKPVATTQTEPPGAWRGVFHPARPPLPEFWDEARRWGLLEFGEDWVAPNEFPTEAAVDDWGPRFADLANLEIGQQIWTYVRAEFFPEL